jgi:hypothetical protein
MRNSEYESATPLPSRTPWYQPGGYGVVIMANVMVAAIIIVALTVNADSAVIGIIAGAAYYFITTTLALLILSGTLGATVVSRQEQVTVRRLHQLQYQAQQIELPVVRRADPLQQDRNPMPQLGAPSFVSPYAPVDQSARREAIAFGLQLYGADGWLDPRKVVLNTDKEPPGRLRVAAPRGEARQWLLDRDALIDLGNGFQWGIADYPTIDDFRTLA